MKKSSPNHAKKMAQLKYQDKIWQLSSEGKSVRDITDYINSCIAKSRFAGTTLSKSTIHTIIKKKANNE